MYFIHGIVFLAKQYFIFQKRNSRSSVEAGNSKLLRNIQQAINKHHKNDTRKERIKMATSMGGNNERGDY